jgi:hypothetical protein
MVRVQEARSRAVAIEMERPHEVAPFSPYQGLPWNVIASKQFNSPNCGELDMAQKGAGGNPGAVTKKGGDGASGSTGTGRGGGKNGNGGKKG